MSTSRTGVLLASLGLLAACKLPGQNKPDAAPDTAAVDAGMPAPTIAATPTAPSAAPSASAGKTAAPSASGCIRVDLDEAKAGTSTVEGTVETGKSGHPNGSSFTWYALKLAKPACVEGSDDVKTTSEVQIFSSAKPGPGYEKMVGKKVRVTGSASPQMTAWHVKPVILDVKTLTAL